MANPATIREVQTDGIAVTAATPASQPGDTFPAGTLLMWPYTATPSGWLRADGTAVSRATYPTLAANAAADSYPDGAGDGSTTFNLPNYTDRVPIGAGNLYARAATGGAVSSVIGTTHLPPHTHTTPAHTHTVTDPGHVHATTKPTTATNAQAGASVDTVTGFGNSVSAITGISIPSSGAGTSGNGPGASTGLPILPPYRACYFIIRAY